MYLSNRTCTAASNNTKMSSVPTTIGSQFLEYLTKSNQHKNFNRFAEFHTAISFEISDNLCQLSNTPNFKTQLSQLLQSVNIPEDRKQLWAEFISVCSQQALITTDSEKLLRTISAIIFHFTWDLKEALEIWQNPYFLLMLEMFKGELEIKDFINNKQNVEIEPPKTLMKLLEIRIKQEFGEIIVVGDRNKLDQMFKEFGIYKEYFNLRAIRMNKLIKDCEDPHLTSTGLVAHFALKFFQEEFKCNVNL